MDSFSFKVQLPIEIIEKILQYLNMDDFMNCIYAFPDWKQISRSNLALTENSGAYFADLLEIVKSCSQINLSLTGLGPTNPGGISLLLLRCVQTDPGSLVNLVSLNISHQTQPIDKLIELFSISLDGSVKSSPFPSLIFLSIRPAQQFPSLIQPVSIASLIIPPNLNELHLYVYGEVMRNVEQFSKLLQLATNVVTLSVCEEFSTYRKWALIFEELACFDLIFKNLRIFRFMDEGGCQTYLKSLRVSDRKILFPQLEIIIVDLSIWNQSPSGLSLRLNYFPDYKMLYTDRTVGIRTQQNEASRSPLLIQRLQIRGLERFNSLYDKRLRSCTVFFNADGLSDLSQLSAKTPIEYELSNDEQVIEYLGISSRLADTTGQLSSYAEHCRKLGLICRVKLIPILQMCGRKLRFVAINQQMLAACAQDDEFKAILLANRGRFPSVKSLHILGTLNSATFAPGTKFWSSIRFLVALFPQLETLRMNYMFAIDPFDIAHAVMQCSNLTTLHIHRFLIETEESQKALLQILTNKKLISLSLLISQPPPGPAIREWTNAFQSTTLRYLHIELTAGGQMFLEEARSIADKMPALVWLIVQCNESHVIEIYRSSPKAELMQREYLRLDTLDLPVLFPQLFNLLWFKKYPVSYCHFPNYFADHFERLHRYTT